MPNRKTNAKNIIARNPRATHDYFIEERMEAGLVLLGWEVKGLRNHSAHIKESYAIIKNSEVWLIGAHITPPAETNRPPSDATRTRKLLLNTREILRLIGLTERKGFTLVPLKLYWNDSIAKLEIGVARGKHKYDKRAADRQQTWEREKKRLLNKKY